MLIKTTSEGMMEVIAKGRLIAKVLQDHRRLERWRWHIVALGLVLAVIPGSIFSLVAPDIYADSFGGLLIQLGGMLIIASGVVWSARIKKDLDKIKELDAEKERES